MGFCRSIELRVCSKKWQQILDAFRRRCDYFELSGSLTIGDKSRLVHRGENAPCPCSGSGTSEALINRDYPILLEEWQLIPSVFLSGSVVHISAHSANFLRHL